MSRIDDLQLRGERARQLLIDPILEQVFADIRADFISEIEDAEPTGEGLPAEVTRAHAKLFALREVRHKLMHYSTHAASLETDG